MYDNSRMEKSARKNQWIADRLKEVGRKKVHLADALGVEPPRITDLINGAREIKATDLQPIASTLDLSLDYVFTKITGNVIRPNGVLRGIGTRRADDNDDHTQPAVISTLGDDYAAVPRWKISAGAGAGNALVPEPDANYRLLFREEWLRRITPAPLNDLVVLDVAGTSMEPTLMDGDLALIDRTQTERRDDAIYVVLDSDEVKIKRVLFDHATGGLILRSDSPMVKDLPPAPADVRQIVGRVIWIGRQM